MAARASAGRIARAVGAVTVAAGAGLWVTTRRPDAAVGVAALVTVGVILFACGVTVRGGGLIGLGAGLLGTAFVVTSIGRAVSIGATVVFATAVLLGLELAFASLELASPVSWDVGARRRRRAELAGAVGAGGASAVAVGVVSLAGRDAGLWLFVLGALSVLAATAAMLRGLQVRSGPSHEEPRCR